MCNFSKFSINYNLGILKGGWICVLGGWDNLKGLIFSKIPKNGSGILLKVTPILTSFFYEYIFDPFILKSVIQI